MGHPGGASNAPEIDQHSGPACRPEEQGTKPMPKPIRSTALLAVAALSGLAAGGVLPSRPASTSWAQAPKDEPSASLPRPTWRVGDTWTVETVTERLQERAGNVEKSQAVRWTFTVAAIEKVAGQDCYRIDVACLAKGRLRPRTSLWCDTRTLGLRQFRTELALAGQTHTILESYEPTAGGASPILTPLNALPIDLPAFLPSGSKGLDAFTYTSQPLPVGAKDPGVLRFLHTVKQDVGPAGAKALDLVPERFAKDLDQKPIVQVRLQDTERSVIQLWQQDKPWPVYTSNGQTKATLVSVGHGQ
jgi:hypothetical protein